MRFLVNPVAASFNKYKVSIQKPISMLLPVRVFITDLILRHSAEVVETYSQSAENACVYKGF